VTVGVPLKDTIKVVDDKGMILQTLERSRLWPYRPAGLPGEGAPEGP